MMLSTVLLLHTLAPFALLAVPSHVGARARAGTLHRPAAPLDTSRPPLAIASVQFDLPLLLPNCVTETTGAASTPLSSVARDIYRFTYR